MNFTSFVTQFCTDNALFLSNSDSCKKSDKYPFSFGKCTSVAQSNFRSLQQEMCHRQSVIFNAVSNGHPFAPFPDYSTLIHYQTIVQLQFRQSLAFISFFCTRRTQHCILSDKTVLNKIDNSLLQFCTKAPVFCSTIWYIIQPFFFDLKKISY